MLRRLSILPIVCVLIATSHAQSYQINAMSATGSMRFSSPAICAASGLTVGETVSLKAVEDAADRLVLSGAFSKVGFMHTQLGSGMRVSFAVTDKPADQMVPPVYDNLVWLTPEEIDSELRKRLPLYNGSIPLLSGLKDDATAVITSMLAAKGIPVHVQAMENDNGSGTYDSIIFSATDADVKFEGFSFIPTSGTLSPDLLEGLAKMAQTMVGQDFSTTSLNGFTSYALRRPFYQRGMLKGSFGPPATKIVGGSGATARVHVDLPTIPGDVYRLSDTRCCKWREGDGVWQRPQGCIRSARILRCIRRASSAI